MRLRIRVTTIIINGGLSSPVIIRSNSRSHNRGADSIVRAATRVLRRSLRRVSPAVCKSRGYPRPRVSSLVVPRRCCARKVYIRARTRASRRVGRPTGGKTEQGLFLSSSVTRSGLKVARAVAGGGEAQCGRGDSDFVRQT